MVFPLLALTFGPLISHVVAQTNPMNTNPNCHVGAFPQFGSTAYFFPNNTAPVEAFAYSNDQCDSGSYAAVGLYSSTTNNLVAQCDSLQLDTDFHPVQCSSVSRGAIPAGPYEFRFQVLAASFDHDDFTVAHTQATSTAAAVTTTVTTTPTSTSTSTVTSSVTITTTGPAQVTVTSPAASEDGTVTLTPASRTTTLTRTRTFTDTSVTFTLVESTRTRTARCTTQTVALCPARSGKISAVTNKLYRRKYPVDFAALAANTSVPAAPVPTEFALERRDNPQGPDGVEGDDVATTTVTPAASMVTSTAGAVTTTITVTSDRTSTVTVAPSPATTTVYTGTAMDIVTITVSGRTVTRSTRTTTHTTSTSTVSVVIVQTSTVHPTCGAAGLVKAPAHTAKKTKAAN